MAYLGSQPLHDCAAELGACDLVADERCNDDFETGHAPSPGPEPLLKVVSIGHERLPELVERRFAAHVQSSLGDEQTGRAAVNEVLIAARQLRPPFSRNQLPYREEQYEHRHDCDGKPVMPAHVTIVGGTG